MGEFERRARVVIEPADQPVVDLKLDTNRLQDRLHRLKMLAAPFIQKLADARQFLDDRLILSHLTVKHAQRIGHRAAAGSRHTSSLRPAPAPDVKLR